MRIEKNRKLLRDFFFSAGHVLEVGGCVMVTLCGGQGGVTLDPTARRYDDSWKVVLMASYANMVLRSVRHFTPKSYPGYSATGYRSMEKGFCQASALTYVFQVSALPPEPADPLLSADVVMCNGEVSRLPSFVESRIRRDIVADSSSFAGYFYDLLIGMLRERLAVRRCEKLVFEKEGQEGSLRKYCEELMKRELHEKSLVKSEGVCVRESLQKLTIEGETGFSATLSGHHGEKLTSRNKGEEETNKDSDDVSKSGSLYERTLLSHLSSGVYTGEERELRDNPSGHHTEKLMSRCEEEEESYMNSEDVSKCGILRRAKPTIFCHSAYRISTKGSLRLEPLIVLLCLGNTRAADDVLTETQNLTIRNVTKSFSSETKIFTFGEFIEGKMSFWEGTDLRNTVTCYLISVTSLAGRVGGVEEEELWAERQTVKICEGVLRYSPFSLFPGQYTYDLSFWAAKIRSEADAAENDVKTDDADSRPSFTTAINTIITNIGGDALKNYVLLGVYDHPKHGRRSFTYRIVYRSWHGALSDERAKLIHTHIGLELERCLGVEVRW